MIISGLLCHQMDLLTCSMNDSILIVINQFMVDKKKHFMDCLLQLIIEIQMCSCMPHKEEPRTVKPPRPEFFCARSAENDQELRRLISNKENGFLLLAAKRQCSVLSESLQHGVLYARYCYQRSTGKRVLYFIQISIHLFIILQLVWILTIAQADGKAVGTHTIVRIIIIYNIILYIYNYI